MITDTLLQISSATYNFWVLQLHKLMLIWDSRCATTSHNCNTLISVVSRLTHTRRISRDYFTRCQQR